jgi:ABC-2 type transport system ATP-binding protein
VAAPDIPAPPGWYPEPSAPNGWRYWDGAGWAAIEPKSATAAVSLRGLCKRFGQKVAVWQLSLDVPRGSFFGLVGPNGAGKTTTLRMATGMLRPDAGQAWIDGQQVWPDPVPVKARIGVLPEELNLFERLTGAELLTYHGLLRGMPEAIVRARAGELMSVLGLADANSTMVVDYSHGMRKKIALAAALLHGPAVLFLDEPFEAIDPVSSRTIKAVLDAHTRQGGTVIFSSHVMELVESLCDRVAIINGGQVITTGTIDEVRQGHTFEEAFVHYVGAAETSVTQLGWLGSSSD